MSLRTFAFVREAAIQGVNDALDRNDLRWEVIITDPRRMPEAFQVPPNREGTKFTFGPFTKKDRKVEVVEINLYVDDVLAMKWDTSYSPAILQTNQSIMLDVAPGL